MVKFYDVDGAKTVRCPQCNKLMKLIDDGEGGYFLCLCCHQVEFPENSGYWHVRV